MQLAFAFQPLLLLCLPALACLASAQAAAFLQTKPSFLATCRREGSKKADFEECLAQAFQHIFTDWRDGIAGSPSIDPLVLPQVDVTPDRSQPRGRQLNVKMHNLTSTGLAAAKVLNVSMKANEYSFKMSYSVPSTVIRGRYSAVGQVSLFKLDTTGDLLLEIVNGVYTIFTKVLLRPQDGTDFKFFDLKALKFSVNDIQDVRLNFSNLFKDEALTKNTNAVFNERWRVFFEAFQPRIERTIGAVLLDHYRSVFAAVPADFFVADVANKAESAQVDATATTTRPDTDFSASA